MSRANSKPKELESYFPADSSPLAIDLLRRMVRTTVQYRVRRANHTPVLSCPFWCAVWVGLPRRVCIRRASSAQLYHFVDMCVRRLIYDCTACLHYATTCALGCTLKIVFCYIAASNRTPSYDTRICLPTHAPNLQLVFHPEHRITVDEALEHAYLSDLHGQVKTWLLVLRRDIRLRYDDAIRAICSGMGCIVVARPARYCAGRIEKVYSVSGKCMQ